MAIGLTQEVQKRVMEIDTYRSHGLFKEAKIRCRELRGYIEKKSRSRERSKFLAIVSEKVNEINAAARAFEMFTEIAQMSAREQAIVRRLFSSSSISGADAAAFEGGVALLIFGQHAAAAAEFRKLLGSASHGVAAAKNILRCHTGSGRVQKAVDEYRRWVAKKTLPPEQLKIVREFLQGLLKEKGVSVRLAKPAAAPKAGPKKQTKQKGDDFFSVLLPFPGDRTGLKNLTLDVNFHRGRMLNCIVPKSEQAFLELIQPGTIIPDAQLNTEDTISFHKIRITEKETIRLGDRAGDITITMDLLD